MNPKGNPQNLKPRKKGDPPLPGCGRPKDSARIADAARAFLSETDPATGLPKMRQIMQWMYEQAKKGDVSAVRWLTDRAYGQPTATTELSVSTRPEDSQIAQWLKEQRGEAK
jgi:hypothetical protein